MLRVLGGLLVIGGCSGLGLWYRFELGEGLRHLLKIRELLELLMSEIDYRKSTLPEACRQVGLRLEEPFQSSLLRIYEQADSRGMEDFGSAWRQEMGSLVDGLPFSGKEKEMVLGFADSGSLSDCRMQIRVIEQYRDMIDSSARMREMQLQKQGRMATGLGIMSGLLLVVILL